MATIPHNRNFKWNRNWRNIDFSGLNEQGIRRKQEQFEIYVRGWLSKQNAEGNTTNNIHAFIWRQENPLEFSVEVNIDPGPIEDTGNDNNDEGGGSLSPTPPPQPPPPFM